MPRPLVRLPLSARRFRRPAQNCFSKCPPHWAHLRPPFHQSSHRHGRHYALPGDPLVMSPMLPLGDPASDQPTSETPSRPAAPAQTLAQRLHGMDVDVAHNSPVKRKRDADAHASSSSDTESDSSPRLMPVPLRFPLGSLSGTRFSFGDRATTESPSRRPAKRRSLNSLAAPPQQQQPPLLDRSQSQPDLSHAMAVDPQEDESTWPSSSAPVLQSRSQDHSSKWLASRATARSTTRSAGRPAPPALPPPSTAPPVQEDPPSPVLCGADDLHDMLSRDSQAQVLLSGMGSSGPVLPIASRAALFGSSGPAVAATAPAAPLMDLSPDLFAEYGLELRNNSNSQPTAAADSNKMPIDLPDIVSEGPTLAAPRVSAPVEIPNCDPPALTTNGATCGAIPDRPAMPVDPANGAVEADGEQNQVEQFTDQDARASPVDAAPAAARPAVAAEPAAPVAVQLAAAEPTATEPTMEPPVRDQAASPRPPAVDETPSKPPPSVPVFASAARPLGLCQPGMPPPAPRPATTATAVSLLDRGRSLFGDDMDPALLGLIPGASAAVPSLTTGGFQAVGATASSANESVPVVGFQTGNGKAVKAPSKAAVDRARAVMAAVEAELAEPSAPPAAAPAQGFTGFATAGNRPLPKPSKSAMDRALGVMAAVDAELAEPAAPALPPAAFAGFATAGSKPLPTPSKSAMTRARGVMAAVDAELAELAELVEPAGPLPAVFVGFATAGNKPLPTPSKASLARSKQLRCEVDDVEESAENASTVLQTPSKPAVATAARVGVRVNTTSAAASESRPPPPPLAGRSTLLDTTNAPKLGAGPKLRTSAMAPKSPTRTPMRPPTTPAAVAADPGRENVDPRTGRAKQFRTPLKTHGPRSVLAQLSLGSGAPTTPLGLGGPSRALQTPAMLTPQRALGALPTPMTGASSNRTAAAATPAPRSTFGTPFKTPRRKSTMAGTELMTPARTPLPPRSRTMPPPRTTSTTTVRSAPSAAVFDLAATRPDRIKLGLLGAPREPSPVVDPVLVYMTSVTAAVYVFPSGWDAAAAHADLSRVIESAAVNSGQTFAPVSAKWVRNHYRWIIWKRAALIRAYAVAHDAQNGTYTLRGGTSDAVVQMSLPWTENAVLDQLRYRYEREVHRAHRPVLTKVLEKDEAAHRAMVLCVARRTGPAAIEVTDGWYSAVAHLDGTLARALDRGRLAVGSKIVVWGAQLAASAGDGPVEATAALDAVADFERDGTEVPLASTVPALRLHANGVKPARYDARLGAAASPLLPLALRGVAPQGGLVSAVRVQILRKYPIQYQERRGDGTRVTRKARDERAAEREYNDQVLAQHCARHVSGAAVINMEDEELARMCVTGAVDQVVQGAEGTERQRILDRLAALPEKVVHEAREALRRQVTPLVRIKVACVMPGTRGGEGVSTAVVTCWRPDEALLGEVVEGRCFEVQFLTVSGTYRNQLRFSTMRGTRWRRIDVPIGVRSVFTPRVQLDDYRTLATAAAGTEVDVTGVIVEAHFVQGGPAMELWVMDATGVGFVCIKAMERTRLVAFHDRYLAVAGTPITVRNAVVAGRIGAVPELRTTYDESEISVGSAATGKAKLDVAAAVARLDVARHPMRDVDWDAFFASSAGRVDNDE
ncbi:hypothetical protein AMAG_18278 [Allomyces macrogynus ATCC 38327]|uniref:BRCA2 OB1 domain-containing protein n=1 Tax=Allomyces macrogynus (strain ATCC 38327) TaxID=578462 RepID=A0A0L0S7P4_ALLM3|nr:hypothetical protein AMAG_18278 [Allomyces macrogynus ATCC 38327]|eukprot:KNE58608.1 hypothetical protein AMAG_18278 [Allomyces macrogynus ATCC 38327]